MAALSVKILDCTLRDGGYINNWKFSYVVAKDIIDKLDIANVDIIEVGFLDQTISEEFQGTKFKTIEKVAEIISSEKYHAELVAMIMIEKFSSDHLIDREESALDGIRVCFKKDQLQKAIELAKDVKRHGYNLYMQPASITDYSDAETEKMLQKINDLNPRAVYIVDTYGLMQKEEVLHYYKIFNEKLSGSIEIGFHSHNNLQLSFSNSQELIAQNTDRTLIIDSSTFGMGRGAGNLCTELITKFINDNIGKKYDLLAIMEVIDQHINPLFQTYSWGYSVPYYVAAIDKCHPNYAMYLVDKHSLGVNAIHNILVNLPEDKKRNYDEYVIQKLYITYQDNEVDDFKELKILKTKLQGREVLLLAPGRSIEDKEGKVKEFIHKEKPIIISINFLPEEIDTDFLFIGNKKRYDELELKGGFFDVPQIVVTSNVVKIMPYKGMVINYNGLINANYREVDISGAMAIRLLKKMDITQVYLAGFDGFSVDDRESFCNEKLYHKIDSEANELRNSSFEEQLQDLSKQIDLRFITPTRYRII